MDSISFSRFAHRKGDMHNDYIVASVFEPKDVHDVARRVNMTGKGVDWILTCIHGCEQLAVDEVIQLSKHLGNSIEILKPDFWYRHRFIPKESTWLNLRKNYAAELTAKKAIWLLDTDIWLDRRFIDEYVALYEQFPVRPLMTQPTILQNTQDPRMKNNQNFWDMDSMKFAYSSFIEEQAVMMDPKFFVWLMDYAVDLISAEYAYESDFGMDNVWCGLGTVYDAEAFRGAGVSPCGIIALPMYHMDNHTDIFQNYESEVVKGMKIYETEAFKKLAPYGTFLRDKLQENNPLKDQACRVCCLHQCQGNETLHPGAGGEDMIAFMCCHTKMACDALPEVCELDNGEQILFPVYTHAA